MNLHVELNWKTNLLQLIFALALCDIIVCKPNVLLILLDDFRPNLRSYGFKSAFTPNIDELSAKSFIFKNAFCQVRR